MRFDVYQFEIHNLETRKFWKKVEKTKLGLKLASGCYIFSIKHGKSFKPWYVGKAEKTCFSTEVFNNNNKEICQEILEKPGRAYLFLLPKLTPTGRIAAPGPSRHVHHLELLLISQALKRNRDLFNVHHATMLNELTVPGLFNDGPGQPPLEAQNLKRVLGLQAGKN